MSKEGKPRTIIVNWQPPSEANGKITGKIPLSVCVLCSNLAEAFQPTTVWLGEVGVQKLAWSFCEAQGVMMVLESGPKGYCLLIVTLRMACHLVVLTHYVKVWWALLH